MGGCLGLNGKRRHIIAVADAVGTTEEGFRRRKHTLAKPKHIPLISRLSFCMNFSQIRSYQQLKMTLPDYYQMVYLLRQVCLYLRSAA